MRVQVCVYERKKLKAHSDGAGTQDKLNMRVSRPGVRRHRLSEPCLLLFLFSQLALWAFGSIWMVFKETRLLTSPLSVERPPVAGSDVEYPSSPNSSTPARGSLPDTSEIATPNPISLRANIASHRSECLVGDNDYDFPDHGCTVHEFTKRPHCQLQQLVLDRLKISSLGTGGEPLEAVLGQNEANEYLTCEMGAFVVPHELRGDPTRGRHMDYVSEVLDALEIAENVSCDESWNGTTYFLARYEYANLYHTLGDWWNTFFSIEDWSQPVNLVWLDAHPRGALDDAWRQIFGGRVQYLSQLHSHRTCFETARLIPTGHNCPIYPRVGGRSNCADPELTARFVDDVLGRLDLQNVERVPGRVVVLERVPYLAHARSNVSAIHRSIDNLRERALSLPHDVVITPLVDLSFRDQVALVRSADVLLGNHGAGLTHELFLHTGATVIELSCAHGFFPKLAAWKGGIRHHCLDMVFGGVIDDEYWEDVERIIQEAVTTG